MSGPTPFLFGKLPAHGDFVSRGLSPSAEQLWDDWASAEIAAAQTKLGGDFDEAHAHVHSWAFIAGPGPLGETWRAGVILPSADAVQRRFMLIAGFDGLTAAEAAHAGSAVATAVEHSVFRGDFGEPNADNVLAALTLPRADLEAAVAAGDPPSDFTGVWWSSAGGGKTGTGPVPPSGLLAEAIIDMATFLNAQPTEQA